MRPYHLIKLVEWAGELQGRKRLQKVVFLLQAAGCKAFDADFILHRFGPYSSEVAGLADQLVANRLLTETEQANPVVGTRFSYQLTDVAKKALADVEHDEKGAVLAAPLKDFETKACELLEADVSDLEYGATIVYFYQRTKDWEKALTQACTFKALAPESRSARTALKLAHTIVA